MEETSEKQNPYLVPSSIIVAGVLIASAIVYANVRDQGAGVAQVAKPVEERVRNLEDNDPVLGNPEAPVTIVEFGDFQCPFCGRFFKTTEQQIIDTYVKAGKAKFVYRDFAFLGDESEWAAEAAECANEQGKFWEYHDYLFTHQQGENEGAFAMKNLKSFARVVGLNAQQFDACLDSHRYLDEVRDDTAVGRAAGVQGTPASFVNGILVSGAVPFEQFEKIIEEEIAKAGTNRE